MFRFQSKAETAALALRAKQLDDDAMAHSLPSYNFVDSQKNLDRLGRLGRRVTIAGFLVCLAIFAFLCFAASLILQLTHNHGARLLVTIGWLTYIPIVLLWIFKGWLARHTLWIPITK